MYSNKKKKKNSIKGSPSEGYKDGPEVGAISSL